MAACCPTINGTAVTYKYDADGLRTTKQVGSTLHEYEYVGDQLVYEKRGNLKFFYQYNALGELASIKRVNAAGSEYVVYVVTNSRGDVEELRNTNGTLYARYVYDSWGNNIAIYNESGNAISSNQTTFLAVQNPFRYRGYYYDNESGLYYLQSRYYDPVVGRFISADSQIAGVGDTVQGYNLYAYCFNNPVSASDSAGEWPSWTKAVAKVAAAVATVAVVVVAVTATAGLAAIALGASATVVSAVTTGALVGGITAGATNIAVQSITKGAENISVKDVAKSTAAGSAAGGASSGLSSLVPAAQGVGQEAVKKVVNGSIDLVVSSSAYILQSMSQGGPTLGGLATTAVGSVITAMTCDAPELIGGAISTVVEYGSYIGDLIDMFGKEG